MNHRKVGAGFEQFEQRRMLAADPLAWEAVDWAYGRIFEEAITLPVDATNPEHAGSLQLQLAAGDLLSWQASRILGDAHAGAPNLQLFDPAGNPIGESLGTAERVVASGVELPVSGNYELRYLLDDETSYELELFVNAIIETETLGGPKNNSPASAIDLNRLFQEDTPVAIAHGYLSIEEETVLVEEFHDGELSDDWHVTSTGSGRARIEPNLRDTQLLQLDSPLGPGTVEATFPLDLSSIGAPHVDFDFSAQKLDRAYDKQWVPRQFEGTVEGNGLSVSPDGDHWWRIPNGTEAGFTVGKGIDLEAGLAVTELDPRSISQLKFQFTGGNERSAYDSLSIAKVVLADAADWYRFDAAPGEQLTINVYERIGESFRPFRVELYNAAHELVLVGRNSILVSPATTGTTEPSTFYVRITGDPYDYQLRVQKDISFSKPLRGSRLTDTHRMLPHDGLYHFALGKPGVLSPIDEIVVDEAPTDAATSDRLFVGSPTSRNQLRILRRDEHNWHVEQVIEGDTVSFGHRVAAGDDWLFVSDSNSIHYYRSTGEQWERWGTLEQQRGLTRHGALSLEFYDGQVFVSAAGGGRGGAVLVYDFNVDSFDLLQRIEPSEDRIADSFGVDIDFHDHMMVVSGYDFQGNGWTTFYEKQPNGTWQERSTISPPETAQERLGASLAYIDSNTLAIGDWKPWSTSAGVFIYKRSDDQGWLPIQRLEGSSANLGANLEFHDDLLFSSGIAFARTVNSETEPEQWIESFRLEHDAPGAFATGDFVTVYSKSTNFHQFELDGEAGVTIDVKTVPGVSGLAAPAADALQLTLLDDERRPIAAEVTSVGDALQLRVPPGTSELSGPVLLRVETTNDNFAPSDIAYRMELKADLSETVEPFEVERISNGRREPTRVEPFELRLSHPISARTLDVGDIRIDGMPAVGVYIDRNRIYFDAPLADGEYTLTIDEGSMLSTMGQPIGPFTAQISVDLTLPQLLDVSIHPGDIFEPQPRREIYLELDEPLWPDAELLVETCHLQRNYCTRGQATRESDTIFVSKAYIRREGDYVLSVSLYHEWHKFGLDLATIPFIVDISSEPFELSKAETWGQQDTIGAMLHRRDIDPLTVEVAAHSLLELNFTSESLNDLPFPAPQQPPMVEVISPSGRLLERSEIVGNHSVRFVAEQAGEYQFILVSQSDDTLEVRANLSLNFVREKESAETMGSNDQPENAESLEAAWRPIGAGKFASIVSEGQQNDTFDWYHFTIERTTKLAAQLTFDTDRRNLRPNVELIRVDTGETLTRDSFINPDIMSRFETIIAPGDYRLKVTNTDRAYELYLLQNGQLLDTSQTSPVVDENTVAPNAIAIGTLPGASDRLLLNAVGTFIFEQLHESTLRAWIAPLQTANQKGYSLATNGRFTVIGGSAESPIEIHKNGQFYRLLPNPYGPIHGLALNERFLYIASGNQIHEVALASSESSRSVTLTTEHTIEDLALRDGKLYLASESTVYEIDLDDGSTTPRWTACCEPISAITFVEGQLYAGNANGSGPFDTTTGTIERLYSSLVQSISAADARTAPTADVWLGGISGTQMSVDVQLSNEIQSGILRLYAPDGETLIAERRNASGIVNLYQGQREHSGPYLLTIESVSGTEGQFIVSLQSGSRGHDLNDDGQVTPADLDLLAAAIRGELNGRPRSLFDINDDEQIDRLDYESLVEQSRIVRGDANFDGVFDTSDLVAVWQSNLYEQQVDATWATGDWNGDGRFTSSDLVAGYQAALNLPLLG